MTKFDQLFQDLKAETTKLRERYLKPYLPAQPEHTPDVFEHDVKSFCVLSHASLEEFVELISDEILSKVEKEFQSKKISLAAASLLLAYADRTVFSDDENSSMSSCFDAVRLALENCKVRHAKTIADNHGFSTKYLRKLLHPVGINTPNDEIKMSSVRKLADARGSFAHSTAKNAMYGEYRKAKTPLTPEDASAIVNDCIDLCGLIRDSAKRRW